MAENLIIYYSRKGENYVNGNIRSLEKGNTEICAEFIRKAVGGDLFELETVKDYAADYYACIDEAKREMQKKARPELKHYLDDISGYDNIFICGPCWWGLFPMAIYSQVERLDWKGKKVMVLVTHEGSGLSGFDSKLQSACPNSEVLNGLAVRGNDCQNDQDGVRSSVDDWVTGLGY